MNTVAGKGRIRAVAFWSELFEAFRYQDCLRRAETLADGEGDWYRGLGLALEAAGAWAGANRRRQQEARDILLGLLAKYQLELQ